MALELLERLQDLIETGQLITALDHLEQIKASEHRPAESWLQCEYTRIFNRAVALGEIESARRVVKLTTSSELAVRRNHWLQAIMKTEEMAVAG